MAKKSKPSARTHTQKKADEKLFLKLLQNVSKAPKQKTTTKSGDRIGRNDSKSNRPRKSKPQKLPTKSKVSVQTKTHTRRKSVKSTSNRIIKRRTESGRLYTEPQKRGSKRIDYTFEKVRSIDKKINLFKQQGGDAIKKELRKRGGKPPRGIIVTVFDKQGREHTQISPLDFVVNKANVENFVGNMLDKMKVDFMAWKDGQKTPKKAKRRKGKKGSDMDTFDSLGPGDGGGTEENPYGDYNPDDIASITIKFIV